MIFLLNIQSDGTSGYSSIISEQKMLQRYQARKKKKSIKALFKYLFKYVCLFISSAF